MKPEKATLLFILIGALATTVPAPAGEAPAGPGPDDVVMKILKHQKPVFPLRLLRQGVASGEVNLVIEVSREGELTDWLITAYTHQGFADATLAAVQTWIFQPSRIAGQPVTTVANISVSFEVNGVLLVERCMDPDDYTPGKFAFHHCRPSELDHPLTPLKRVAPSYPKQLGDMGVGGKVTVDFFVDESGKTRMPVVAGRSDDSLAGFAIAAVKQWRFEPPTRGGIPVLVRVSQDFNFVPANPPPPKKES